MTGSKDSVRLPVGPGRRQLVKGRSIIAIPQNSFGRKQFKAEGNLVFWESLAMAKAAEKL